MMKPIDRVYGRPYKNPNRWMVTQCYVKEERHINWALVIAILTMLAACAWFAWALHMM